MEKQREDFYELKKNLIDSFRIFLLSPMFNYYFGRWLIKANKGFQVKKKNVKLLEGSCNAE
jgi:hypothetical protein